ncbi:protein of unknown function DUF134 [Methanococcus vannielii SB]|jgi:predicted DNA-binding protein (UPF0251 family)|uniref:UPF0251 protein Mevan_1492 n=1 Tax=Methanococcus vannielii (strain ATCC 35089 / DSM 1224 / JCM 13029 / OCM 148 / SB) TaxID=406327 RepID=Y1492_METVS|nr:DUF134 domain-containing protein [Methanococcus vannielii]A6USB4.1 RecName: Full=UPF0251 protein Mevan_1492 [Methanococcus vannielii SB]ABR55386.1 protein of unknown function DUF134 [Methanococcus vannielii SB]
MQFRKGRPKILRLISEEPKFNIFKPVGIPKNELESVVLTLEELESLRLVDYVGQSHEDAADSMGISRRVFWNILKSARKKVSDALINGKMIDIGGGYYQIRKCNEQECQGMPCRFGLSNCFKNKNKDNEL